MVSRVHIPTARKNGEPYEAPHVTYIGRQRFTPPYRFRRSFWHNPYSVAEHGREEAVALYREYILHSDEPRAQEMRARLGELEGKTLGCWCTLEERCHGDVLAELAG